MKVDVIIPVYKPNKDFYKVLDALENQSIKIGHIILMNTEEKYYKEFAKEKNPETMYNNIKVFHLSKEEFDHGKTRALGVEQSDGDIFVMMTQDATPKDTFLIERLTEGLKEEKVACAYARQLPYEDCRMLEAFQRSFNYPENSEIKSIRDVDSLGIKTFFCSNVCCAYKRSVYDQVGGFIKDAIFNEDMIYAHKVMTEGYSVMYQARAEVFHSHNYNWKQQFQRNFDLGVSQAMHPEVFEGIKSETEGIKSVKSAMNYLTEQKKYGEIFRLISHSGFKFLGYKFGKNYQKLPKSMVIKFSMNKEYWKHSIS